MTNPKKVQASDYYVSFGEATKRFFTRMFNYSGRATRAEYWKAVIVMWILDKVIAVLLRGVVAADAGEHPGANLAMAGFGLLVASVFTLGRLSLTVRRLHDRGESPFISIFAPVYAALCVFISDLMAVVGLDLETLFSWLGEGVLAFVFPLILLLGGVCALGCFIISFFDSKPGRNRYGDSEKYPEALQEQIPLT